MSSGLFQAAHTSSKLATISLSTVIFILSSPCSVIAHRRCRLAAVSARISSCVEPLPARDENTEVST
jgi:hypothetical protein